MDPINVSWVLDGIKWLIDRFDVRGDKGAKEREERSDHHRKQIDDAVRALMKALIETRIYFGTQRLDKRRDREKEESISRLWTEASEKVKPLDEDIATRCYTKGTYWADPIGWEDNDFREAGIKIELMEEALRRLK